MQWITSERPKIDRIACTWLVTRFIDKEAIFHCVPIDDVLPMASTIGAIPYGIPGVELIHVGKLCSFDAFLKKYKLNNSALKQLAVIVRGGQTRYNLTLHRSQPVFTRCHWVCPRTLLTTTKCLPMAWSSTMRFIRGAGMSKVRRRTVLLRSNLFKTKHFVQVHRRDDTLPMPSKPGIGVLSLVC